MKKWHKFIVTADIGQLITQPISSTYQEHESDLGGFGRSEHYKSKESFFQAYFFNDRRAPNYDKFISQHIDRNQHILSVASGRSVNELMLLDRGFDVTCSDLSLPESYSTAKRLFPQMNQLELDILSGPAETRFDVVICLSLIYLFDNDQLRRFFANIRSSLTENGYLILDSSGPPDTLLAHWVNEIYLKYEAKLVRVFMQRKFSRSYVIVEKHHGYRHSDKDILQAAKDSGLMLTEQKNYDYTHEFERSRIISKLLNVLPFLRAILRVPGRSVPYTRMFKLQRV